MFSKACEYGIKATIFINQNATLGVRVNLKTIAVAINSPEAFTAKILQLLAKNQIINSEKGATGGFTIPQESLGKLKLADIVNAIDGDKIYKGCGLGMETCNDLAPCPMHDKFKIVRDSLREMLENTTVSELASNLDAGFTFLKR